MKEGHFRGTVTAGTGDRNCGRDLMKTPYRAGQPLGGGYTRIFPTGVSRPGNSKVFGRPCTDLGCAPQSAALW